MGSNTPRLDSHFVRFSFLTSYIRSPLRVGDGCTGEYPKQLVSCANCLKLSKHLGPSSLCKKALCDNDPLIRRVIFALSRQCMKWVGVVSSPQMHSVIACGLLKRRWYAAKLPWPVRAAMRCRNCSLESPSSGGLRRRMSRSSSRYRDGQVSFHQLSSKVCRCRCNFWCKNAVVVVAGSVSTLGSVRRADLAAASASSFPCSPECPGTHFILT